MAQHHLSHAARRREGARMNVRSATLDDLARHRGALAGLRGGGAPACARGRRSCDRARRDPGDRRVRARLGGRAERRRRSGWPSPDVVAPRVGRITDLYVVPTERRAGVADALLRAVAARLAEDGVDTIDLEVMASNAAARAVYCALGLPRRGARARSARRGARRASRRRQRRRRRSARSTSRPTTST